MPQGKVKWFSAKKVTDLSEKKKKKRHISTRFGVGRVKIENIKRKSNFKFDIKKG